VSGPRPRPVLDRIAAKVATDDDGCLIWLGATTRGYGRVSVGGRGGAFRLTHRVLYEELVGPIPEGMQLDHLCRVRGCCLPAHLEPVTPRENGARSNNFAGINGRKTHCLRGHEFTAENTRLRGARRCCIACDRIRRANRSAEDVARRDTA
jgi:hypothetical protein